LGDEQDRERAQAPGLEAADEITNAPGQAGGERQQNGGQ